MYNGRLVDVFDLQPEDIIPKNFIHALALINRYTGATKRPFSVAEHTYTMYCYNVSKLHSFVGSLELHRNVNKAILLHDWTEALFNDIAGPVKKHLITYKKYEHEAALRIFSHYGVPIEYEKTHVKPIDIAIRVDEKRYLWSDKVDLVEYQTHSSIYEGCSPEPLGIRYSDKTTWNQARECLSWAHENVFGERVNFG